MALPLFNTIEIIETMENYIDRTRPADPEIRKKLDISYRIDKQSVILFEIRPVWDDPTRFLQLDYAKATWLKKEDCWKIFWLRASGNWDPYSVQSKVQTLQDFLQLIDDDEMGCFKG